ncbi:VCBS repeat-containing protein [Flammeovirga yaeyamensis]|uniref:VCBS repeat-containing protein n=1 Tax=Flammeovirga yaeyamensis TaxID=367791 RepID=A0AAX1N4L4_9BACT|nr:FG-GAP-like repeat-containing protein [Flammeovirga yaeyamensis]MBB3698297.1 hypothetical protein [Flammeovirga yaeyamensis]NMF34350.1 T9SS type A sorting domain-containing protein [Flammeovirga yaeyamensis]QWG01331.1 VCBS repeat-containing protein [Flammeovirga yaeyamensis]
MKDYILTLLILFNTLSISAQNIGIVPSTEGIKVSKDGKEFINPFFGGLNAPQFSNLDLDLDGNNDLVIFDRTSRKVYTFLWKSDDWIHAPEYELIFPQNVRFWMQLIDFNQDGTKDLIIGEEDGIYLYKNTSTGSKVAFDKTPQQLFSTTFSGNPTPLSSSLSDTPAIVDVNNDGLVDFVTFVQGLGGTVESHINQGIENGTPTFKKTTDFWGNFQECGDCATYIFGNEQCPSNQKIMHLGASITLHDVNGNGLYDLIIGEKECNNLVFLPNKGTASEAVFDEVTVNFPDNHPILFPDFPAAYFIDTNNDQVQDMIIAPNVDENDLNLTDFSKYIWRYTNTGTPSSPVWTLQEEDFLQNTGIDVGQRSRPALYDVDQNGTLDLLIGYRNAYDADENPIGGGITYYKNIGSNENPSFEWVTDNYLNIIEWGMIDIYPQIVDWNGDGKLNLIISGAVPNSNQAGAYLFDFATDYSSDKTPQLIYAHRPDDVVYFYDINQDGKADLLHGKFSGSLEYHQQQENESFQLEDEAYLGLSGDILRKYPSAFIYDLNNDGNLDLLVWDDSGTPRIWRDFKSDSPEYQGRAFFSPIDNEFNAYTYGNRLNSVILNNYLITGSESGGITIATLDEYDQPLSIPDNSFNESVLSVYPNPASQEVKLRNTTNNDLQITIYNHLGQYVDRFILKGESIKVENTQQWSRGVYFIRAVDSNNSIQTSRLILQ